MSPVLVVPSLAGAPRAIDAGPIPIAVTVRSVSSTDLVPA